MMGGMKRRIRCGGKPMTAIVLAGGRGRRMKADKASLDIGGKTLLEHVLAQVEPLFDEILIVVSPGRTGSIEFGSGVKGGRMSRPNASTASPAGRVRVVEDERSGLGPLGGVLSGLRAARHEACAVIACDIPDIDIALLRSLAGAAGDVEIAVPVGPTGLYEPLFAVYRRPVVPEIESLLDRGERSVLPLYEACRTAIVRFKDAGRIRNLNTRADYEAYLRAQSPGRGAKL
jgi:molybdopterin-guanine dinucleotide biosynthesis protein A